MTSPSEILGGQGPSIGSGGSRSLSHDADASEEVGASRVVREGADQARRRGPGELGEYGRKHSLGRFGRMRKAVVTFGKFVGPGFMVAVAYSRSYRRRKGERVSGRATDVM